MTFFQRILPLWLLFNGVSGCTNILITPGASADGSAIIAYNSDDVSMFGYLYHYPASEGKEGETIKLYDWNDGHYAGEIPQVNKTYNVVGNGNERGLVIGETTFGGVPMLASQTGAIMDYGSLIYLTLQRASTAREAIQTMSDLMDTYGYSSTGESISIADANGEVWIMEVIGRGNTYGKKGAVWVAQRVPDGMMSAHANLARITTFPRDDPENCLFSPDVVDVAVHYGLYPADKDPLEFSFSDTYNPVTFVFARFNDARVWSFFSQVADQDGSFQLKYQDYASGHDLSTRMPLFIKPYKKLEIFDVMTLMNSHYEGTELDGSRDVGAGMFEAPYRPRPITWEFEGKTYFNERTVAAERTGFNFIGQIRTDMPLELALIMWFACDDSSTAPRSPVYASSTQIAHPFAGKGPQDGVMSPVFKVDLTKAFWVQNMVSNLAYSRWKDAYPIIRTKIDSMYWEFQDKVKETDATALMLLENLGRDGAIEYLTNFSVTTAEDLHQSWMDMYGELFVRFRDFSTIVAKKGEESCGCEVHEPGIAEEWKRRIVLATGSHYEVKESEERHSRRLGAPEFARVSSNKQGAFY